MGDWDDEDEWDVDDAALDAKLGIKKDEPANNFDDEVDEALLAKEAADKANQAELKKKGNALAEKKAAEKERTEELELARKAMELEAELEESMTPDERRELERRRVEEADNALTDDLFGGVDGGSAMEAAIKAQNAGDAVVMKDLKDHMKHARRVADCMKVRMTHCVVVYKIRRSGSSS
jgi:translation initiation factor 3 subunit J